MLKRLLWNSLPSPIPAGSCVVPNRDGGSRAPVRVALVTGQSSQYHNWQVSSAHLLSLLEQVPFFETRLVVGPPSGGDMAGFRLDFAHTDVVVIDYEGDAWPREAQAALTAFVRSGGGLVSFHATDNAFPKWQEFNEMIGVGGWGNRDESWGPKVRWRDGKAVEDTSPGTANHPPSHEFPVVVRDQAHPIMRGLPRIWMHAGDEIYSQLRGPARNLQVLATALADDVRFPGASGEHEPVLMTIRYGGGRVFHTTLGHVSPLDTMAPPSLRCAGFVLTFLRGVEWAATGSVTLPLGEHFPDEHRVVLALGTGHPASP